MSIIHLGRSQMCAGAWYVFSTSKPHSGTLCFVFNNFIILIVFTLIQWYVFDFLRRGFVITRCRVSPTGEVAWLYNRRRKTAVLQLKTFLCRHQLFSFPQPGHSNSVHGGKIFWENSKMQRKCTFSHIGRESASMLGVVRAPKNVERFTILRVILAQGPC